jgi:hypothetical protein
MTAIPIHTKRSAPYKEQQFKAVYKNLLFNEGGTHQKGKLPSCSRFSKPKFEKHIF